MDIRLDGISHSYDGVAVMPLGTDLTALIAGCQAQVAKEEDACARCAKGTPDPP